MADRPSAPLQVVRRLACLLSASDDGRRAGDSAFAWLSADPVFAAPAPMPPVTIPVAPDGPSVVPSAPSRRRAALA